MEITKVRWKKLHPEAKAPIHATHEAACFDFYAIENTILNPGEVHMVATGVSMEVPKGYGLQIWDRSGLGAKGIHRFAGIVDSDYRNEIKVVLFNSTKNNYEIKKGERIGQGMIVPYVKLEFEESEELDQTDRKGGFGTTGK